MAVNDELKLLPDTSFVLNISFRLGVHPELRQWGRLLLEFMQIFLLKLHFSLKFGNAAWVSALLDILFTCLLNLI